MFAKMVMVGDNIVPVLAVLLSVMPFYFATLEEFYVGALYLPVLNGITDGSAALISVNFAIGYLGSEFFAQPVTVLGFTYPACHLAFVSVIVLEAAFTLKNIGEIVQAYFRPIDEEEHYREPVNFIALFQQVMAFVVISGLYIIFGEQNKAQIQTKAPLAFALSYSFVICHMAMNVMLAHLTRQKFNPWSKIYLLNFITLAALLAAEILDV